MSFLQIPPATPGTPDPPADGTTYGRRNNSWTDITSPANLQVRRGTAAEINAVTPLQGEPVYATDSKIVVVGDGTTSGGVPVSPTRAGLAVAISGTPNTVGAGAIWVSEKLDLSSVAYPVEISGGVNPHVAGNARGLGSVDFTNERTAATQVASGVRAFAGPGSNTSSNVESVAFSASTASGIRGFAISQGTASGTTSIAAQGGTASGWRSAAFGGTSDRAGMFVWAANSFFDPTLGRGQGVLFGLRNSTSSTTPTTLRREGGTTGSGHIIPSGVALFGIAQIIAVKTVDGANVAHFIRQFGIMNVGGATSLIYSQTVGTDHNPSSLGVSLSANDTNDTLEITVTGNSAALRWVAIVNGLEQAF